MSLTSISVPSQVCSQNQVKFPHLFPNSHTLLISICHSIHPPVLPGEKLQAEWNGIPVGACLLKKPPLRLNGGKELQPGMKRLSFGVFRTCDQFVEAAVAAGHPVNKESCLPSVLHEAVNFVTSHSMKDTAKHRLDALKFWLGRAKALKTDESALHSSLPTSLKSILAPKRLLLWKEMMEYYDYPDCEVYDEVTEGVQLAGTAPHVPFFDPCFKPAKIMEAELASTAKSARKGLLASVRSSGDAVIDAKVYAKTLEELSCGWLEGPYEPAELPNDAVVSRRFGILQTSGEKVKVRLIDDFSASGVNATVQVDSAAKLHTLDVAAALCMELLKNSPSQQWLGKTVDLSAAYRQLGIAPSSRWVSYIAVFDPESRSPKVFAMRALPFGASRSVYAFLRTAHSLWWLGCKILKLTWSNFFDDFITLAREPECDSVSLVVTQFFKLLGWGVSDGEKDLPFSAVFKALGVEIDLTLWKDGRAKFANTEKRINELLSTIDKILEAGKLSEAEALSLRGRMQFAHSQLWGRSSKLCLNAVTAHAYASKNPEVDDGLAHFLRLFKSSLVASRPREVTASWDMPMFVFTDASFNPESDSWPCGIGGVLVDPWGCQVDALSYGLKRSALSLLGYPGKSTVIFEAELLALLVCFAIWKKQLRHRPCVFFIDNNATRDVNISGRARSSPGSELVADLLALEDSSGVNAWYARVPSLSNVADGPSRGSSEGIRVKFMHGKLVELVVEKTLGKLRPGLTGGRGKKNFFRSKKNFSV